MFGKRIIQYLIIMSFLASVLFMGQYAYSAFNPQINYQGKLTNSSSVAVSDGGKCVKFRLMDSSSGGTELWTEEWKLATSYATTTSGLFSVLLGSHQSLSSVNFNQLVYLEVQYDPGCDGVYEEVFSPRKKLGAVPAAFEAGKLDGIDSSQFLRSDTSDTMATSSSSTILTVQQDGSGRIIDIKDGSINALTVLDGGNVGIATSTPSYKLHVWGSAGFGTSTVPALYIEAGTGRVGIGTSTPLTKLAVTGGLAVTGATRFNGVNYTWPSIDGTNSYVLKTNGAGVLTWQTDASGGGSSVWATTSNGMAIYPTDFNDIVVVGAIATTTSGYQFEVVGSSLFDNIRSLGATSTQNYTSVLGLNSEYFTDLTGSGLQNINGVLTLNNTGNWLGTLGGYYQNSFLTTTYASSTYLAKTGNLLGTFNGHYQNDFMTGAYASSTYAHLATLPLSLSSGTMSLKYGAGLSLSATSSLYIASNAITDAMVVDTITASNYLSRTNWFSTTTVSQLTTLVNLTTVGTIGSGIWQGTSVKVGFGGTGLTSATAGYTMIGATATALQATSTLFVSSASSVGIGDLTPDAKLDITEDRTSGILIQASYESAKTLVGGVTGIDLDLANNVTPGSYSVTGLNIELPTGGTGTSTTFAKFYEGSSELYNFNPVSAQFNVPASFNAAGDVSLAYDLILTNNSAGYIKFNGPGYIQTEDASGNYDLTLSAANAGSVVINDWFDMAATTTIDTDLFFADVTNNRIGLATTTPSAISALFTIHPSSVWGTSPLLKIATSTTQALFINSTGNVGVGTTTPAWKLHVFGGGICVDAAGGGACPAQSAGAIAVDTGPGSSSATSSISFDIAERYSSNEVLRAGEVVVADTANSSYVKRSTMPYESGILGVVSAKPAIAMEGSTLLLAPKEEATSTKPYIVLAGRVPVRVSTENGPIAIGDALTSASSTPGVAMKANKAGRVIGIALEPFVGANDNIASSSVVSMGAIIVFINPHWQGNDLTVGENVQGEIIEFTVDRFKELASELDLEISGQGVLKASKIMAQNLEVGSSQKPSGITLYDEDTGEPYCLKIKAGAMVNIPGFCASSSDVLLKLNSTSTPETLLVGYPESLSQSIDAKFEFSCLSGIAGGCSFECKVNDNDWERCESPKTYVNLNKGEYKFQVFAVDKLGRSDPLPQIYQWIIDFPEIAASPNIVISTSSDIGISTGQSNATSTNN